MTESGYLYLARWLIEVAQLLVLMHIALSLGGRAWRRKERSDPVVECDAGLWDRPPKRTRAASGTANEQAVNGCYWCGAEAPEGRMICGACGREDNQHV